MPAPLASYAEGWRELLEHPGVTHLAGKPQQGKQAQPQLFKADVSLLLKGDEVLQEEVFGPTTIIIEVADQGCSCDGAARSARATDGDPDRRGGGVAQYAELAGCCWNRRSGGSCSTVIRPGSKSVMRWCMAGRIRRRRIRVARRLGRLAIDRFLRPVCFQNYPDSLLPDALKDANPLGISRLVNGQSIRDSL
jgi:alpha-ketoglutaric semialdehyde dehydrogenase